MKIETYIEPKSAFLSVDKDLSIIVERMLKNDNLKKLLHYTVKDCLNKPKLSEDESLELISKNIKLVPKVYIDKENLVYIIIRMRNFTPNGTNPEFRDNVIEFDIICHYDQWHLKDFQLRPYRIAAEIDSMFNDKHLTGIGDLKFLAGDQLVLTDKYGGFCLQYYAIHGGEDKKNMPNPRDEKQFVENFNNIFNED